MNEALSKAKDALAKIDKAREVVNALCDGRLKWTLSVPARPEADPDLVIADALRSAEAALSAISNVEQEPIGYILHDDLLDLEANGVSTIYAKRQNRQFGPPWTQFALYTSPIASGKDADIIQEIRELRRVADKYAEGDLKTPWASVRDQLVVTCEAIDAALAQKGGSNV